MCYNGITERGNVMKKIYSLILAIIIALMPVTVHASEQPYSELSDEELLLEKQKIDDELSFRGADSWAVIKAGVYSFEAIGIDPGTYEVMAIYFNPDAHWYTGVDDCKFSMLQIDKNGDYSKDEYDYQKDYVPIGYVCKIGDIVSIVIGDDDFGFEISGTSDVTLAIRKQHKLFK